MISAERARAREFLDLQEGRGPVRVLNEGEIVDLLANARRIAVVGASVRPDRASNGVFRQLRERGYECVPVNPLVSDIDGVPAFATLAEAVAATGPVDIVDVFRRAELCPAHAVEAVTVGARCLWLQLGIVSWEAARIAAEGGISVVMNRCTAIEIGRLR